LGHANEAYTIATANSYGWKWTGQWVVCEFCALAKSKQKSIKKFNSSPVEKLGERAHLHGHQLHPSCWSWWLKILVFVG
jgi:hypothetical protein